MAIFKKIWEKIIHLFFRGSFNCLLNMCEKNGHKRLLGAEEGKISCYLSSYDFLKDFFNRKKSYFETLWQLNRFPKMVYGTFFFHGNAKTGHFSCEKVSQKIFLRRPRSCETLQERTSFQNKKICPTVHWLKNVKSWEFFWPEMTLLLFLLLLLLLLLLFSVMEQQPEVSKKYGSIPIFLANGILWEFNWSVSHKMKKKPILNSWTWGKKRKELWTDRMWMSNRIAPVWKRLNFFSFYRLEKSRTLTRKLKNFPEFW